MNVLSGVVVVAFAVFLLGFAVSIYARPSLAERFLNACASSARAHYVEQVLRLVVGGALISFSPAMLQSQWIHLFGWIIVTTTVGLLLVPWRWHQKFARWVVPPVIRHMKLYSVGVAALAAFLLYSVVAGALSGAG